MVLVFLLMMTAIVMVAGIAFTLATYALPFVVGLSAAQWAYGTGAGLLGAAVVGLLAAGTAYALLALALAATRSNIIRAVVALVFLVPAGIAGYHLIHGVAAHTTPSETWRQVFAWIGAVAVGGAAGFRLLGEAAGLADLMRPRASTPTHPGARP